MNPYLRQYNQKKGTALEVAYQIRSGWTCFADIAVAMPYHMTDGIRVAMEQGQITDVTMNTLLDTQSIPFYEADLTSKAQGISWFSGRFAQEAINERKGDIMPCNYHSMPELIRECRNIDAFLATVSPMDEHGYFTTGCIGSNSRALIEKAKHIFLEVNENMPKSLSAPIIHISQVSALCEHHAPLKEIKPHQPDVISMTIGRLIADEIPDGATIQLGIGAIPEAVGMMLKGKRDLGIHTEMFTDSMLELIVCGAVTNALKPIHRGKSVATFAMGTKKMYDFINNNPAVEILAVDYVNDPEVIAKHPNFISVNSALEVDFFGQVCAESIGTRHVSGTGGQIDYVRGAVKSIGGKSFIAFGATAKNGTISKIKPTLTPGAIVTTGKNDVDWIVTEYGLAEMRGKTLAERTRSLIAIAHPKFRAELTEAAKQRNILFD